ncbi:hypothetical protein LCGC14_2712810 [marine sediment metagenome]|uniref:Uncharacterized protein n=1 Tax=marine sediment metagenome TaxID=412755 RepID=A0A0F9A049_9ZZZZ
MDIPDYTLDGLQRYIQWGIPTGSFLQAVLSNDLFEAFATADITNRDAMFGIVGWIYNNAPSKCHGNAEAYKKWIEMHRIKREKTQINL